MKRAYNAIGQMASTCSLSSIIIDENLDAYNYNCTDLSGCTVKKGEHRSYFLVILILSLRKNISLAKFNQR